MWPFSRKNEKHVSNFEATFLPDEFSVASSKCMAISDPYLLSLLTKRSGTSFNQGIYRLICGEELSSWTEVAESAFPEFSGRLIPFGFDWLGRMFVLDRHRSIDGASAVTLLEPGTGAALETPCTAESFHEVELIDYSEAALAESFFRSWINSGGASPMPGQCVGYRKPLFLGGSDTLSNLELTDLKVYWGIAEQLLSQTRGLPVGTIIGDIRIQ